MIKQMTVVAASLLLLSLCPAANAQFFNSQESSIDREFNNFNSNLDSQSERMQTARDRSAMNAAQIHMINMQSNQDTENAAEQAFQNGQENMIDGGGAYNSQGFMWGSPWGMGGGFGGGMGSGF